jgi:glycosyltransferase involved in cell wall biosynthesis
VVVDDASTDTTAALATARGARVVAVDCRHIAAARNAGARAATGDILIFVDADTLVDRTVLQAALDALAAGAAGGGAAVHFRDAKAPGMRAMQSILAWLFRRFRIAPGCFIFCTRAAFERAGGFDERWYAGEDIAISRALAKVGRFVILRETVQTSPRKLHTHSAFEQLTLMLRFALGGRRLLKSRTHLDLWYGRRR